MVFFVGASDGGDSVARRQPLRDRAWRQMRSGERVAAQHDLELANVAAPDLDRADPRNLDERGSHDSRCGLAQHARIDIAGDVERQDRQLRRGDALDANFRIGRQLAADLGDVRFDELQRAPHVRPALKLRRQLGRSADRPRANPAHPGHGRDRFFEGARRRRLHDFGRQVADVSDDHDSRKFDFGIDAAGQ